MINKTLQLIAATIFILLSGCSGPQQEKEDTEGQLAAQVKSEFQRSWQAYKTYAWGHDVLLPISKGYSDWYEKSLHISPIDAYSTMKVMGLDTEAEEVRQYVVDSINFDKNIFVKTFEVNIRILGGLLSMYGYTHDEKVLALAEDFGRRMLPAFNSPTGIPYYWVNLQSGETKGNIVNVAEGGSCLLEMGVLSHFTKDPVYYEAAKSASKAIFSRRSDIGLIGTEIDVESGKWTDENSHVGCCIDSYYEYLYKSWLLLKDPEIKQIWDESIAAVNKYVADDSDSLFWYGQVNMQTGEKINSVVTLYDAYFPALLALSGDLPRAEKLQASWDWLWSRNSLEPMVYDYGKHEILNASYDLNPEIMESAYYLYHFTKNEKYRDMAERYYSDLLAYCRNDVAFTSIKDVVTKEKKDYMPTFFLAETLKYLYLTFSPEDTFKFDDYVFSTEAHPFKKSQFSKE